MTGELVPPELPPLDGDEQFLGMAGTVRDFWAFAIPDLRTNNVRGWLAEYLVWRALGVEHPSRREWDTHDVEVDGLRVEVKASGYLQAWKQRRLSTLTFSGLAARAWPLDSYEMAAEYTYNADVYVFAVQTATTHDAYAPLDVSQWRFAELPRATLTRLGFRSITWARVLAEAGGDLTLADLGAAIRAAATIRP